MSRKIFILGSCVSRDPFNPHNDKSNNFHITNYFSRTSLASLSLQAPDDYFDFSKIPSAFQRRMVEWDFKKTFWHSISETDFDVLLIDFIDDRLNIAKKYSCGFTLSPEFKSSGINQDDINYHSLEFSSAEYKSAWIDGLKKFSENPIIRNNRRKILINKVFLAYKDNEGNDFEQRSYIDKLNNHLTWAYDRLQSKIGPAFIEYDPSSLISDTKHKWGRSPFHYTNEVERICIRGVEQFLNQKEEC